MSRTYRGYPIVGRKKRIGAGPVPICEVICKVCGAKMTRSYESVYENNGRGFLCGVGANHCEKERAA